MESSVEADDVDIRRHELAVEKLAPSDAMAPLLLEVSEDASLPT